MNTSVLIGIPCLKTGGTEIQTLRLVEALTDAGYNCVTVCYFEYDFAMVQAFERAGSLVVCLSAYGRRPQSTREVYKFLKIGLQRVVNEYHPTIAHIQYMAPGAVPVFILRRLGIKTILATLHTDASIYRSLWLVRYLQRHVVTAFTCVTEVAERSFFGSSNLFDKDFRLKKHNHITIHNCLPAKYVFNSSTDDRTSRPQTIGVVARLESIKGADFVVPAFAKVLERKPDAKLIIVGDGKLRSLMEQQQNDFRIAPDRIEWAGRVEYEKLPEYYKRMDIVWVPSRSEGFGLSAIEAMAQGCAVVASDTGGLAEIINNGVDGILFKKEDINDLADKTIELFDRNDLFEIRQHAVSQAQQFSFNHYAAQIKALYSKLST